MSINLERKSTHSIERSSIVQQTAFWSELKENQGIETKAFDIKLKAEDIFNSSSKNFIRDDFLILFQKIGKDTSIGYVPYGPTIEPNEEYQGQFLEELSESLKPHLDSSCVMLRYDLLWESPWAKDDSRFTNGDWVGPPEKKNQELRLNFSTHNWNLKKANTNVLPKDTLFIDLTKNEEDILMHMKSKTRYNIRLSERKGVTVRKAQMDDISIWYDLYKETCTRNGIFLDNLEYFKTVLKTDATDTKSPATVELLIAEYENKPLAAIFVVYSGKRATYLYGASSSRNRNLMAPYLLQWEAIKRSKQKNCAEYDMFGIAPYRDPSHPMYGLYRFKTGFGGNIFHRMGCWDYPLNTETYDLVQTMEMKSQGYHVN
ncbi:MAG: peptidoglycan bridge formation glycyltransferase FemA/FemB family protein [Bacteroidetes bacterium]|nr:peptidoglycan bridge formation glycyltransferase FemA/FemB family protein [Bacteroidota bacterium]